MNAKAETIRLSQPRVGWVFEGGGAKGSFSFAAARHLARAGVPRHCVSGTSVGALNALLFSCNQDDMGNRLWSELHRKDVLPFKSWKIFAAPYGILLLFLHSYVWTRLGRRGWPDRGRTRRILERSALGIIFLPIFGFSASLCATTSWVYRICGALIGLSLGVVIWWQTSDEWPEQERRQLIGFANTQIFSTYLIAPLIGLLDLLSRIFGSGELAHALENQPVVHGFFAALAFHLLAIGSTKASLLSNSRLRQKIVDVLKGGLPTIPTYATVAYERWHFDPDYPSINSRRAGETLPDEYFPVQRSEFVPMYVSLHGLQTDAMVDCLTASAALPFGLIAAMLVNGHDVVDGGVADNVPVRPLVDIERCDVLFVFRLNRENTPRFDDLTAQHPDMENHWKRSWRKEDVSNFEPNYEFWRTDWKYYIYPKQPERLPWRETPNHWPKIIVVAPKENQELGGLLEFGEGMRLQRERWGQEAAERALKEWTEWLESQGGAS